MLQAKTKWKLKPSDEAAADQLLKQYHMPELAAKLFTARGLTTKEEVQRFISPDSSLLADPFILDGMELAIKRIRQAQQQQEKLWIYGDYDADGVCSTALLVELFTQLGLQFDYYIPHRFKEGYGLNKVAIDQAHSDGITLIVTVDNGISACEEVDYAASKGIDVVITDHHECPARLPDAYAIINPKKPACAYPFKWLAGVGVAYKLAQALLEQVPASFLELVAIGTIADIMPLVGENRYLVKAGVEQLQSSARLGIRALLNVSGQELSNMNETTIGFSIAPRLNAAGRMRHADAAVRLLIAAEIQTADEAAVKLDQYNQQRQQLVEQITEAAMSKCEPFIHQPVLVLEDPSWHLGVVGIVAAKVVERTKKPTIILSVDPQKNLAKGSARSVPGLDMHQALAACDSCLEQYGGHQAAAGMTVRSDRISEFRERLNDYALANVDALHADEELVVELKCRPHELTLEAIEWMERLAPFGPSNPKPLIRLDGMRIEQMKLIGKQQNHLKLLLFDEQDETPEKSSLLDVIGFHWGEAMAQISQDAELSLIGECSINDWNQRRKPQLMVKDMCISELQLFDWRNSSVTPEFIIRYFQQRQTNLARHDTQKPLICIHQAGLLQEAMLWEVEDTLQIAAASKVTAAKDLVLYDLPENIESFRSLLQRVEGLERIYIVCRPQELTEMPSRDRFKHVYAALKQRRNPLKSQADTATLASKVAIPLPQLQFILQVFSELEFLQKTDNGFIAASQPEKRDLASSELYRQQLQRQAVDELLRFSSSRELRDWILDQRNQCEQADLSVRAQ